MGGCASKTAALCCAVHPTAAEITAPVVPQASPEPPKAAPPPKPKPLPEEKIIIPQGEVTRGGDRYVFGIVPVEPVRIARENGTADEASALDIPSGRLPEGIKFVCGPKWGCKNALGKCQESTADYMRFYRHLLKVNPNLTQGQAWAETWRIAFAARLGRYLHPISGRLMYTDLPLPSADRSAVPAPDALADIEVKLRDAAISKKRTGAFAMWGNKDALTGAPAELLLRIHCYRNPNMLVGTNHWYETHPAFYSKPGKVQFLHVDHIWEIQILTRAYSYVAADLGFSCSGAVPKFLFDVANDFFNLTATTFACNQAKKSLFTTFLAAWKPKARDPANSFDNLFYVQNVAGAHAMALKQPLGDMRPEMIAALHSSASTGSLAEESGSSPGRPPLSPAKSQPSVLSPNFTASPSASPSRKSVKEIVYLRLKKTMEQVFNNYFVPVLACAACDAASFNDFDRAFLSLYWLTLKDMAEQIFLA